MSMIDCGVVMRLLKQKPAREQGRSLVSRGLLLHHAPVWLFQKTLLPEKVSNKKAAAIEREKADFSRIRCPLCEWQPRRSDRWVCADGGHPEYFDGACGTVWNTFDTRGVCPGCNHRWRWTTCLSCHESSPHPDWYAEEKAN